MESFILKLKRPSILKIMLYLPVVYQKSTFSSTVLIIVFAIKTNPLCFLQNNIEHQPCTKFLEVVNTFNTAYLFVRGSDTRRKGDRRNQCDQIFCKAITKQACKKLPKRRKNY